MRKRIHYLAVLAGKYYCFYCNKSYDTVDARQACVDACYRRIYGDK